MLGVRHVDPDLPRRELDAAHVELVGGRRVFADQVEQRVAAGREERDDRDEQDDRDQRPEPPTEWLPAAPALLGDRAGFHQYSSR